MSDRSVAVSRSRRRYRWTKRILLGLALLFALLGAVRWWWGAEAQRRYDAYVAEVHARGGQILIADFALPAVRDADNAAILLEAAARAATWVRRTPLSPEDAASDPLLALEFPGAAEQLIEESCAVPDMVRQALKREQTGWGIRLSTPLYAVTLPPLSPQRDLARVLCGTAAIRAMQGDVAEAAALLRSSLELSHRISAPPSFLISWLIGVAVRAQLCATIERVAPRMNVAGLAEGSAARHEVERLIADLLDETRPTAAAKLAMSLERAGFLDSSMAAATNPALLRGIVSMQLPLPDAFFRAAFSPALILDGVRGARRFEGVENILDQPNWPLAEQHLPRWSFSGATAAESVTDLMSNLLMPAVDRALERQYSDRFGRRAAATALAIRLYEADHGERPAALAELVPKYLPAVPLDPFSQTNDVLRYDPSPGVGRISSIRGDEENAPPGGIQWNRYEFLLEAEIRRPQTPRSLLPPEPEEE